MRVYSFVCHTCHIVWDGTIENESLEISLELTAIRFFTTHSGHKFTFAIEGEQKISETPKIPLMAKAVKVEPKNRRVVFPDITRKILKYLYLKGREGTYEGQLYNKFTAGKTEEEITLFNRDLRNAFNNKLIKFGSHRDDVLGKKILLTEKGVVRDLRNAFNNKLIK